MNRLCQASLASCLLGVVAVQQPVLAQESDPTARGGAEATDQSLPDIVVTGHTDTVGSAEANDKLSMQRAERVKGFLTGIGIPADRIQVAGRGERELLVPTADNIDEPRNRRTEINVR